LQHNRKVIIFAKNRRKAMTTLQLNQQLFQELAIISKDEDKLKEAISALKKIALGIMPSNSQSHDKHVAHRRDLTESVSDEEWKNYFADKPAVDLPYDTKTQNFVEKGKGRIIKQIEPWL
jgi:hypothetical protein